MIKERKYKNFIFNSLNLNGIQETTLWLIDSKNKIRTNKLFKLADTIMEEK